MKKRKRRMRSGTTIEEITDRLLKDPSIADKLRLVDAYIAHRQRAGRRFVLPAEHAELESLIEQYAGRFPQFVDYVRRLRDTVAPKSNLYISLHELYRMLDVRLIQQQRRDRARRALDLYESRNPKATWEDKIKWLRKLEQSWGRRRMAFLDDRRRKTAEGRLSTEEREELLAEFWEGIDKEIKEGKIPQ